MRNDETLTLSARPQILVGFVTIAVLMAVLLFWAVTTTITGAVVASGTVEVESDRQVVQHPQGGVVSVINARNEQFVAAGDILIVLDTNSQKGELELSVAQLFELRARQDRFHSEQAQQETIKFNATLINTSKGMPSFKAILDGQRQLFQAARRKFENETTKQQSRKQQLARQIEGLNAQELALILQLELLEQELVTQRTLRENNLTHAGVLIKLQRQEAQLRGKLGELVANRAAAAERMIEMDLELERLISQRIETNITAARDLDAPIRQHRREIRALRDEIAQAEVRAPVSGIVYGMSLRTTRAVLRPAEPLLYIIPQDRPLIVAMQLSPRHIDQIGLGQRVNLRLTALDQSTTPEVWGRITQVSADAIADKAGGPSYYRAEMILTAEELKRLPLGVRLLPGMPVEAFIRTGEHSPMAYLIKPVTDYFARAFRES